MPNRHKKYKISKLQVIFWLALVLMIIFSWFSAHVNFQILNPKGFIADKQKSLILTAFAIMLIAVVPALFMTYFFAWKYRDGRNERYTPAWEGQTWLKISKWILPVVTILILASLTWKTAHELDPMRPIASANSEMIIQVVAMDWKWLFIYPEQNLATLNYVEFPENTPIDFQLTSTGLMNLFWIPQLGGQMSAMAGMETNLHLMADAKGEFQGLASEINGKGFADMRFEAKSVSQSDFDAWIKSSHGNWNPLTQERYDQLAISKVDTAQATYSSVEQNMFANIIMKFMMPGHSH